jgi:hypothetical protein
MERLLHDDFKRDVKCILGDPAGLLRTPPERSEQNYANELYLMLLGEPELNVPPDDLEGSVGGYFHVGADEKYELRYLDWGGQFVAVRFPPCVPKCRLWYLVLGDMEFVIALVDVDKFRDGYLGELRHFVAQRIRAVFGEGMVEAI